MSPKNGWHWQDAARQPDNAGLQPVTPHDAPEALPDQQYPHNPHVIGTPDHEAKQTYEYFGSPQSTGSTNVRPYYDKQPDGNAVAEDADDDDGSAKRLCGLRRKTFFWLLALALIIVAIAAVLGGVLGSVLTESSPTSTPKPGGSTIPTTSNSATGSNPTASARPPAVQKNTGQAVIETGGSTYQYVLDSTGRLVENQHKDNTWSIPDNAVIATDARTGSPIAATSYQNNGVAYRQVFYINKASEVVTSNKSNSGSWSAPYNILTDDLAAQDSIALAVVSATDAGEGLDGMRVYFASSSYEAEIREVGFDWADGASPIWNMWQGFQKADASSGASVVLSGTISHLYMRNESGVVQQWQWNYADTSKFWQLLGTMNTSTKFSMASGSDLAVVNDGSYPDYIFYATPDSKLSRAEYDGKTWSFQNGIVSIASGSQFVATFDQSNSESATEFYYQSTSDSSAIQYETVTGAGAVVDKGKVG